MAVSRFYKNNIAEGKSILVFSIIFAVVIRMLFYLFSEKSSLPASGGYLWQPLVPFLENSFISLLASSAIVAGLAVLAAHINTAFVLIRRRTALPATIMVLLFSCHPSFIQISPAYLGALSILLVIRILFSAYNSNEKSIAAFRVSFFISLGSLFAPVLLVYIPLSWAALAIVRSFNFKSLFASLLGLFIIYFPVFSFYLFSDKLDVFYAPFLLATTVVADFPFLGFDMVHWGLLAFSVLLLSIIIVDNYLNRHKDKIKIRACLSLLCFTVSIALLLNLFLNITPAVNLYISVSIGALLLSHFFALVERKGGTILFYILLLVYLLICILSFMTIL